MITTALWLYGFICLASIIMVLAWGHAAIAIGHNRHWVDLRWSKPFIIAGGLTIHALAMAAACAYRAYDLLAHSLVELGSAMWLQVLFLATLGFSKAMFVWAGSLRETTRALRWPWWVFLALVGVWGIYCISWGQGI